VSQLLSWNKANCSLSAFDREPDRVPIGFTTLYIQLLCGYAPLSPCHDLANWLSHYLYFFSFFFFSYLQLQDGARESIMWLCHNGVTEGHRWSCHGSRSQWGHMTSVTWGLWESKCIAMVVKCISSREMSENSIEFSLSNFEQRDSWLNSGHRTLDADTPTVSVWLWLWLVTWYLPMLHLSNKRKEILNNNLAILPSHDIEGLSQA